MARLTETVAPDVVSRDVPQPYLNIPTSPAEFGGLLAQGEEKLGAGAEKAGQDVGAVALQLRTMANATDALNRTTSISQKIGTIEAQFRTLSGANAGKAAPAYTKQISDAIDQEAGNIAAPAEKLQFLRDAHSYADRAIVNMSIHAGEQQHVALVNSLQSAIKEEQSNIVRYTATGQEPDFTGLVNKTLTLAHQQGLDQESANVLLQQAAGTAMRDAVIARVANNDTAGAARMFKSALAMNAPGTNLPLLDANHEATISQMIQQKVALEQQKEATAAQRAMINQMRVMAFNEKTQREAAEKAGNGYVTQMLKDPSQVDPNAIANDPSLSYEQKWSISKMLETSLTKTPGNLLSSTYGNGFIPAMDRVQAAVNDPQRITDPADLWKIAAQQGNISPSGIAALTEMVTQRRTPEGEADNAMMKQFLANAKGQISGSDEGMHIKDPKGDELYLRFMATALPSYYDGRRQGKSAADLLNPDSPDYIGKSINTFKRPMGDWMKDTIIGGENEGTPNPRTLQAIIADVNSKKITSEQGKAEALQLGLIAPDPVQAPAPPEAPLAR